MKILNAQELIRLLANPSEIDNFSDENYCANQNVILDDTNGINLCCQQNLTLSIQQQHPLFLGLLSPPAYFLPAL